MNNRQRGQFPEERESILPAAGREMEEAAMEGAGKEGGRDPAEEKKGEATTTSREPCACAGARRWCTLLVWLQAGMKTEWQSRESGRWPDGM